MHRPLTVASTVSGRIKPGEDSGWTEALAARTSHQPGDHGARDHDGRDPRADRARRRVSR